MAAAGKRQSDADTRSLLQPARTTSETARNSITHIGTLRAHDSSLLPFSSVSPGRWLFLADMHFDPKHLVRLESSCEWILSEVARLRPRHIFILGDTLHTRNEVHVLASSAVAKFLQRLLHVEYADSDEPPPHVHILVGNHDMHHESSRTVTSLDSFSIYEPLRVDPGAAVPAGEVAPPAFVDEILTSGSRHRLHMYRDITFIDIDGQQVLFVPYHHGDDCYLVNDYIARVGAHHDLSRVVCLAHLPVTGATISGIEMNPTSGQRYRHASVGAATLAQFQRTFLGHFHIHQQVGKSGRVVYVGAPLQFTYGDANDPNKGFIIYDPTETNASSRQLPWQLMRNPHALHFFSRTLADWEVELDELAAAATAAHTTQTSPYSNKRVEIVLPAEFDTIAQGRRLEDVSSKLRGLPHKVGDIKVRQLKLKEKAAPLDADEEDDEDATDYAGVEAPSEPVVDPITGEAVPSEAAVVSPRDQLLVDLINGDLHPIVRAFLDADPSLNESRRDTLATAMYQLLEDMTRVAASRPDAAGATSLFDAHLQRLEVSNFLSVSSPVTFDFSALQPGIWYITGRNGAGKSLLIEALTWVLFGKTLRGHEADRVSRTGGLSHDAVVNHAAVASNPRAVVRVSVAFANGYTITRTHTHGVSGTRIQIDTPSGPVEPKSSRRLDDDMVVRLLGIDYDRFVSCTVLSSTSKNFVSAKSEDKRRVIEGLLGFTQFETLQGECKRRRDEIDDKRKELDRELKTATERRDTWTRTTSDLTERRKQQTAQVDRLREEATTLTAAWSKHEAHHAELESAERAAADACSAQTKEVSRVQQALDEMRAAADHQRALDLRKAKAIADAALTATVQSQLKRLYAAQSDCTARLNSVTKQADESRLRESQLLQHRITAAVQVGQVRTQLSVAQQKVAAMSAPSWVQTIQKVIRALRDWVWNLLPESAQARLRDEIITPLQHVLSEAHVAPDSSKLQDAEFAVLELQNELDELTRGEEGSKILVDLAQLSALQMQQKELMKKAPQPTKAQMEATQQSDPAYAELKQVKSQIAMLESHPERSSDGEIQDRQLAVTIANAALAEFDASQSSQRQRESTLQQERRDAEKKLASLTQAENASRTKSRTYAAERGRLAVERGKKDQAVESAQEALQRVEQDITTANESGPVVVAALQQSQSQVDSCLGELSTYSYWMERVSDAPTKQTYGFRTFCIQRMLNSINPIFAENLELFSQDDDGAVLYPLGCELTAELTLVAADHTTSLEKRSEGQRKRTYLALFLALFTLSQRHSAFLSHFLFLDEAFDALDEDGQRAVNKWIKGFAEGNTTANTATTQTAPHTKPLVFVITHSSYTNPSVSRGCLNVRLGVSGTSIYDLAPHDIRRNARPFVLTSGGAQEEVQPADLVEDAPVEKVRKPRKPSAPRAKKTKSIAPAPAAATAEAEADTDNVNAEAEANA